MGYSIAFARQLPVDRIFCSTDSTEYASIAKDLGAEVPFLRSAFAACDTAMEQDILRDLYPKFEKHDIAIPDLIVWLRPTFVFRSVEIANRCIRRMTEDSSLTACRTVCESESRLYRDESGLLNSVFDDLGGRSMIRRQDVISAYKVYSLDVFRASSLDVSPFFLGNRVGYEIIPKICGLDIDDEIDWITVENLISQKNDDALKYIYV